MWVEFASVVETGRRAPALHETSLPAARASMEAALIRWAGTAPSGCRVRSLSVAGPELNVPVRVYTPNGDSSSNRPVIAAFHGCGTPHRHRE
jgi:poly(3-hydroxybutyrate) depolymerase